MPKLIMMSGPSGSGKSTAAKALLQQDGNAIRVNRDDLRTMSILKWSGKREKWIVSAEMGICAVAGKFGLNIIVDDTNLMPSDEARWRNVAKELKYDFKKIQLDVDIETCITRDSKRPGNARIGRPTIERQFLRAGLWKVPEGVDVWIFDIDGTLADLTHRVPWITVGGDCPSCKGQFVDCAFCTNGKIVKKNHDAFYERVLHDTPIEIVVKWIQNIYNELDEHGKQKNYVLIVSGRSPEKCGEETVTWLADNEIRYDHLIMRRSNMHGPDDEEKQLILDMILKIIPKERVKYVVDDRPSVVAMWRKNGLHVIPVRGRDDDKFYETMNEADKDWPKHPDMEPCSGKDCACQSTKYPDLGDPILGNEDGRFNAPNIPINLEPTVHRKVRNRERYNCSAECRAKYHKEEFKRPWSSYLKQGVVRIQRWWRNR